MFYIESQGVIRQPFASALKGLKDKSIQSHSRFFKGVRHVIHGNPSHPSRSQEQTRLPGKELWSHLLSRRENPCDIHRDSKSSWEYYTSRSISSLNWRDTENDIKETYCTAQFYKQEMIEKLLSQKHMLLFHEKEGWLIRQSLEPREWKSKSRPRKEVEFSWMDFYISWGIWLFLLSNFCFWTRMANDCNPLPVPS